MGLGGGIFNDARGHGIDTGNAALTVSHCTLSGNSASAFGGGIFIDGAGGSPTVTVIGSTLSGNSAGCGGAIYNLGGSGGSGGPITIINSTLRRNSANFGGGILNNDSSGGPPLAIGSTILDAGASGGNISDHFGAITSLGYSLSSDDGGGFLTNATDQINTDPLLGPLQDIQVGQRCRALHFLHSCRVYTSCADGTPIGAYVIHYTGGEQEEIPIVYGQDVRCWSDAQKELGRATDGWSGLNDNGDSVRLVKSS